jgi:hypothetical protein
MYFDAGTFLVGLVLVIGGLLFGAYQAISSNNKFLETCGEHTARWNVNQLKLMGYEIPEGYEEALAHFYKTGDASKLRKYK